MTKKIFTDEEWNATKNNGTFCPAPFFSYYVDPTNNLGACCQHDTSNKITTLEETYNSNSFKELRQDLVNGVKNKQCNSCWKLEDIGIESYRQTMLNWMNDWEHSEEQIRNVIDDNGSIDNPVIYFMDIRFDNTCNLRCRTCGIKFSSSWYPEEKLYAEQTSTHIMAHEQFIKANVTIDDLKKHLTTVKRIYFAGGEPLINQQHYEILDYLIEIGRTDVMLYYNTNFSKLTHSGHDVIDYWKKFKIVCVVASLDGSYERGEYIRKNISWTKVVANRERTIAEVPHVKFLLGPTISLLNAYNLIDLHREWVEKKYIGPYDLSINILTFPLQYHIKNLPSHHKKKLEEIYTKHIAWINSFDRDLNDTSSNFKYCINGFENAIKLLQQASESSWAKHWEKNQWLDQYRNEDFSKIFPEYADLIVKTPNNESTR